LPGIGPKAIQNIEESLAALTFPEPVPAQPEAAPEPVAEATPEPEAMLEPVATEPVAEVAVESQPEAMAEAPLETVKAEETLAVEKQAPAKKEARKRVEEEEEEDEGHKDGVSLDELFTMKPEIFQSTEDDEDEDSKDKKKGKKGKKKSVALEYDEELGEVVSRKKHKRGDEDFGEDW